MGKIVVETNYRRFQPVGQSDMCASCPSSCKTSCARLMMQSHEIDEEEDFKDFKVEFDFQKSDDKI
ncbi:MAG TPA: hypothetical protein DCM73_01400 [Clostridiales bacterium]|nr:hypothetical protein [Clostridiales bacterium]